MLGNALECRDSHVVKNMLTFINMQNKSTNIHAVTCQTTTFTVTFDMETKTATACSG